jgi:hypothetical protein
MKDKRPSFQFYPGDWRKDPELSRATKAEKGLLVDLMCLMWECEERGIMATSGKSWSDDDISFAAGGDRSENLLLLNELLRKGILRRNQSGSIFSKRMVHDEHKRSLCAEAGSLGGNPTLKGRVKGGVKQHANPNPTPSSSSSSSPSKDKNMSAPEPCADGGESRNRDFARFWDSYPRHEKRKDAQKAFLKTSPGDFERILSALALQKKSDAWMKDGGKYVPHSTTWLNGRRWEDEVDVQFVPIKKYATAKEVFRD